MSSYMRETTGTPNVMHPGHRSRPGYEIRTRCNQSTGGFDVTPGPHTLATSSVLLFLDQQKGNLFS